MNNTIYDILFCILSNLSYWKPKLSSVQLSDDEKTVDIVFVFWANCEDKHLIKFNIPFTLPYELYEDLDMLQLNDKLGWEVVPRTEH